MKTLQCLSARLLFVAVAIVSTSAVAADADFSGNWVTTFGTMTLKQQGDQVTGYYVMPGARGTLEGRVEDRRLTFTYQEPDTKGDGWFQLADDGQSFEGKWKSSDSEHWHEWSGTRVLPVVDRVWLVVVEARWESSLAVREYSFGSMLRAFFNRVPPVQIRHRFFSNEEGFRRWCGELAYLAEPVVLVIASHGDGGSVTIGGQTIGPVVLAEALQYAGDLRLVHFSACEIMTGDSAERFQKKLKRAVPVSGYTTSVDWVASAVIEFLYLNMILEKRMTPADAARQLLKLAPFAGDKPIPDAVIPPAGFRLLSPEVTPPEKVDEGTTQI